MTLAYGLQPQPQRGTALDALRHADLAESLAHLAEATAPSAPSLSTRLGALIERLNGERRICAMAFRSYFDLVSALLAEKEDAADASLGKLEALPERAATRTVTYFGAPEADQISLNLIHDGMRLAPISASEAADFKALLDEGFDLMARTIPDLHAELGGVVHEVLLARAPSGDKIEFDGASHYQYWGLLLLNPRHHKDPLAVVEVLAHEASHSLLFGMTRTEPLVFNKDEERYPSPLRRDPRPMDGIFHAAYVSARMCWAMEQMAASDLISADDRDRAAEAAATDRANWEQGLDVIDAHGRLSPTGERIINAARHAMGH